MPILSDKDIRSMVENGGLGITDFSESCLQPASYDLRLGKYVYLSNSSKPFTLSDGDFLTLEPGTFALVTTHEVLHMPLSHRGRIGMRARYSLTGLLNISGPQIDPGFRGRLTLGIVNQGPRTRQIKYLDRVFTIEFDELSSPATKAYSGEFYQVDGLPAHLVEIITHGSSGSLPQMSIKLERLETKMDNLQKTMYVVLFPFALTIIGALIAFVAQILSN